MGKNLGKIIFPLGISKGFVSFLIYTFRGLMATSAHTVSTGRPDITQSHITQKQSSTLSNAQTKICRTKGKFSGKKLIEKQKTVIDDNDSNRAPVYSLMLFFPFKLIFVCFSIVLCFVKSLSGILSKILHSLSVVMEGGVEGGLGWGRALDAPAHPIATILWPRITCYFHFDHKPGGTYNWMQQSRRKKKPIKTR